ncbi:TRP-domain-containing protein [Xylariaceae sp. FL0016]|nr:TRP-domain-containing protein [Xylariaceae sp. FL0016]
MLVYHRLHALLQLILGLLIFTPFVTGASQFISGTSLNGETRKNLALDRTPALYTGDFGDCLSGESLFNVTKFDAALYSDNSTILFHLDGLTSVRRDDVMLYISVEAYGKSRFSMTVDPCFNNIYSLCPLNASQPIEAFAFFQVGQQQVSGIPQIAYEVPDIDGFAKIQVFSNSSQTEIACFQAAMKNGHSFSQPQSISPVLGIFTIVAIVASFASAIYGVSIPHMRTHYAHSLSILVVFETFQSIFYSGALSLDWPSVLPAWWSNFAWAAGLVPVRSIVDSFNPFVGVNGNASQAGSASTTVINNQGGLAQQIFGRSLAAALGNILTKRVANVNVVEDAANKFMRRQSYNASDPYDYKWNGEPVRPGMPLPGDYSGFPGTLSESAIPAPDAFLLGLVWLLVAVGLVIVSLLALKSTLEALIRMRWVKQDRLEYFRSHWTGYLKLAVLRTLFIAFFSISTLALHQFAGHGHAGPTTIAGIVFALFIVTIGGLALYALHFRLRPSSFTTDSDRILLRRRRALGCIPSIQPVRLSQLKEEEINEKPVGSLPFVRWHFVDNDPTRSNVHQDEEWIRRFGWLSARYRLSRWWFFGTWLIYQLIRASFLGAAATHPLLQVFGIFILDILALFAIAILRPLEGQRNTALAVWLLGLCKVATTGLSIAFLPDFNLDRILTTVIGVVIIIIQSLLTIAVMILVILSGISTWMSLYRNREYFSSQRLEGVRIRYYEHIAQRATDMPPHLRAEASSSQTATNPGSTEGFPDFPSEPHFSVTSVRRMSKIEDEDEDYIAEMNPAHVPAATVSNSGTLHRRPSRTASISSRHSASSIPRAARVHRVSWSARDFSQLPPDWDRPSPALKRRLSAGPGYGPDSVTDLGTVIHTKPSVGTVRSSATPAPGSRPVTAVLEDSERETSIDISTGTQGSAEALRLETPQ